MIRKIPNAFGGMHTTGALPFPGEKKRKKKKSLQETINQPGGGEVSIPGGEVPPGGQMGNPTPRTGAPQTGEMNFGDGSYAGFGNLPNMFASQGNGMFENVFNQATQGSTASFNTAANRLRERIDSSTAGYKNQATSRNLSRGFGNSGMNNADNFRVEAQGQNAYAQGLNELSLGFEDKRLQGLGLANQAASGVNQNRQFVDQQLMNLINSREGRTSNESIAEKGNAHQASMNNANNELQTKLSQLEQQNQNWQQSLSALFNTSGLLGGTGTTPSYKGGGGVGSMYAGY
jgi:FtsZ-binding cell division protein ZapB